MSELTVLAKLKRCGYSVVDHHSWFTDKDGGSRDRYLSIKAPDGEVSKLLESRLNMPWDAMLDSHLDPTSR